MVALAKPSVGYSSGTGISSTATFTLSSAPTTGNLMIMFIGFAFGKRPSITPSGWTALDSNVFFPSDATYSAVYRIAQAGDSATQTFGTTGGDYLSGAMVEISGQDTVSPFNAHPTGTQQGNTTTYVSPAATPSVLNCLALSILAQNDGQAAGGGPYSNAISSGWSILQAQHPDFHGFDLAMATALTNTTSSNVAPTWTGAFGSDSVMSTILIAPQSTVTPSGATLMMMGI